MKNAIIILAVIILIGGLAYAFTMNKEESMNTNEEVRGETDNNVNAGGSEDTVRGTVVSVDSSQVPADGPALVTIRQENGNQALIAIPSMGINLCPAQANIANYSELKAGDMVEVHGIVVMDGRIVPCESADHYFRIATSQ